MLLIGKLETAGSFVSSLFLQAAGDPGLLRRAGCAEPGAGGGRRTEAMGAAGEVRFEDVSFRLSRRRAGAERRDVHRAARHVGGAGRHTGAGKTTRWRCCSGRGTRPGADPDRWQNLRHVTLESLRQSIGVVFQESLLFNRSIRDNLLVGKPEATEAEVEKACRMADAHEFIIRSRRVTTR